MGYSEVYCHICGVSFNISRLRAATTDPHTNTTTLEPRTFAWRQTVNSLGDTFVDAARNSWTGQCERDAGCMIVYREDSWAYERTRNMPRNAGSPRRFGEDDVVEMDEGGVDEDYEPLSEDEMQRMDVDVEEEWETPPESCRDDDEDGDVDMGGGGEDGSENEDQDQDEALDAPFDARYREFVQKLGKVGKASPPDAGHEVVLPLFKSLDDGREHGNDEQGSEASFDCDAEEDSHKYRSAQLDHKLHGKLSFWKHPLNHGLEQRGEQSPDYVWEHIAGAGCENRKGYSGHRITVEEIQGCDTLQCLVRKSEHRFSKLVDENEDWEQTGDWFLSGISDDMPSRDMSSPRCFPMRHGVDQPWAENCTWDEDERDKYAMPFHPTCLEVWKRVCLKRSVKVDIEVLASWWSVNASYEKFHDFPRDPAVKRAQEQEWEHNIGDEFLAANSCFIPGYGKMLEDVSTLTQNPADKEQRTKPTTEITNTGQPRKCRQNRPPQPLGTKMRADLFSILPTEIWYQIFTYLSTAEVAHLRQASRTFHGLPQSYFRHHLLQERPYLWELWCQKPYSRWTGTTACALRTIRERFDAQSQEIEAVLEALTEDGRVEEREACEQYWNDSYLERRAAFYGQEEKPAIVVDEDEVDYAKLAMGLDEKLRKGGLKGLRNRERIWKDCESILKEIDELKKDGRITTAGKLAGKWVFENA